MKFSLIYPKKKERNIRIIFILFNRICYILKFLLNTSNFSSRKFVNHEMNSHQKRQVTLFKLKAVRCGANDSPMHLMKRLLSLKRGCLLPRWAFFFATSRRL